MGAAVRLPYTYQYERPSQLAKVDGEWGLKLATFGNGADAPDERPFFFDGRLLAPHVVGAMLSVLAQVVSTRFWRPVNIKTFDPVVTSSEELLRFEGFSSCCSVYVRADFDRELFDADIQGRGTTNVDFHGDMRGTLAQLRERDVVRLAVGSDQVRLAQGDRAVVEKKVTLPIRWLKGFTEVQAYLPGLRPRFTIAGPEALRFVRLLPKNAAVKQASWITPMGRGLRVAQRESKDTIRVTGAERIRILEPLLLHAKELRIWADDGSGVSAWEVVFPSGRFSALISPELSRGFSGEGQALKKLASKSWEDALPRVRGALHWQSRIDAQAVAAEAGLLRGQVDAALAVLGSRGLVGYDLGRGAYFHRELPFDMAKVEALQPRLLDARELLADGGVRIIVQSGTGDERRAEAYVRGTDVEHHVRLGPNTEICTCPWYGKHQGDRGPCKHVLALELALDDVEAS